jgi:DNA gyrase subunit A
MVSHSGKAARFHEGEARAMGRDTAGVKGMNVSRGENWVLAMDVARDDDELLVVTENGYGKRTEISDYPRKGRGSMGVKTIALTERKGGLAGALIVREHQDLVFISQNGMVQRTGVRGISLYGRASQGVRVMNLREDDVVSAVAVVVEDSADTAADVAEELPTTGDGGPPAQAQNGDAEAQAADAADADASPNGSQGAAEDGDEPDV